MKTVRLTLEEIYSPVKKPLQDFSAELENALKSDDRLVTDIHAHLLKMSGKFLRPALTLLSAKAGDKPVPNAVKLAVAIELIHTATLVHDDIIDNSDMRRNQPSIFFKWGREISIVSGDYLYAKAFLLLAGLKDIWVNEAFAHCAHIMCEGEMKQIEKRSDFLMPEKDYLKIIHKKTAALFQAACMGGAYYSGAEPATIEKFGQYGFNLGMAFQIVDDCMDLTANTETLGKNAGLDIYKNDVTLPLLYLHETLDASARKELFEGAQKDGPGTFEKIRDLAISTKSVEKAMDRAKTYIDDGLKAIQDTPASVYRDSLANLAVYCLERGR